MILIYFAWPFQNAQKGFKPGQNFVNQPMGPGRTGGPNQPGHFGNAPINPPMQVSLNSMQIIS